MEIGEWRGKIEGSPALEPFMPVVQYEIESAAAAQRQIEMQAQSLQFLRQCQQQAIAETQAKIASLSFIVKPLAPWTVLAKFGSANARHFYYDSPRPASSPAISLSASQAASQAASQPVSKRRSSMVGIGTLVECASAGEARFLESQNFIDFWQAHFCIASVTDPFAAAALEMAHTDEPPLPRGHFFCSATFFEQREQAAYYDPAYVFVPQLQVTTQRYASVVTMNRLIAASSNIESIVKGIYQQLEQVSAIGEQTSEPASYVKPVRRCRFTKDVAGFEQTVLSVLQQMNSQPVHKVVLADIADVVMPTNVDVVRSLQTLHQNHPDCTIFSVGNGRGQSFIGASPERLLHISNGELMTDALAGTASRSQDKGLDVQLGQSLLSSQKERYEHRVVVEFILAQLRSLGLNPRYGDRPTLLKLLNLQHLHTPIRAPLTSENLQPLKILSKLHPTPAVAGVPHQLACEFIRQYETFDRGLYTAPIGWVDTQGNSEFIVGIRSALIEGKKARLYAGAGIVSGSEPKKELAEIRLKLQALLNALVCE